MVQIHSPRPLPTTRDFWISVCDYFDKLTASTGSLTNPGRDLAGACRPCQNFWNPLPNA
jgi:hypothetical protein